MFEIPLKIAVLMRDFTPDWFVAGGWAIDLFLEKQTRTHEDIEIAIFRENQLDLQNYLESWNLKKAVSGELVEWKKDEFLELPVHEIHCFNENAELESFEVLLNETNNEDWVFRRNQDITKPISELYSVNNSGLKFLRPEIVLLYKSKNPRAKDEQDFRAVFQHLDFESKEWLRNSLSVCYSDHRWLENLKKMNEENIINSSKAPEPVGLYPHARRVGNLLFLSGVGPRERGTKKIPGVELGEDGEMISYDIEAQCHSVFRNVRYILEESGSAWEKIVDVTVFLTDMKNDFETYNRIYAEYFMENLPCRTTVEINRLPTPIAIELKVIATID